jgi:hypothetical protein
MAKSGNFYGYKILLGFAADSEEAMRFSNGMPSDLLLLLSLAR